MSTDAHLDAILQSHYLPEYAALIQRQLSEERARRQKFYEDMTDEFKMEFIDGEVILHSPARRWHLLASGNLYSLLHVYSSKHGGEVHVEKALCIFNRNDYEPDIVYFSPSKCAQFTDEMVKFPIPDFVVEILSESTAKRDRGVKFDDYASHGVSEYWIIDPEKQILEQYLLNQNRQFELNLRSGSGEVTSKIISGFTIPIRAIFDTEANHLARATLESKH